MIVTINNKCIAHSPVIYPMAPSHRMIQSILKCGLWSIHLNFISCSVSVSQYVLCMTPLSSDGSSDEECVTTVETQHDLTVTSNMMACKTGLWPPHFFATLVRMRIKFRCCLLYCSLKSLLLTTSLTSQMASEISLRHASSTNFLSLSLERYAIYDEEMLIICGTCRVVVAL